MFEFNDDLDLGDDDFFGAVELPTKKEPPKSAINATTIQNSAKTNVQHAVKSKTGDISFAKEVIKRKFPGPAGLLPCFPQKRPFLNDSAGPNDSILCSQASANIFEHGPWLNMYNSFKNSSVDGLCLPAKYNIEWIHKNLKKLVNQRGPFLAAMVENVSIFPSQSNIIKLNLKDPTGDISASIFSDLYDEYKKEINVGCVLVLRQFGVLDNNSVPTIIITQKNLVTIYPRLLKDDFLFSNDSDCIEKFREQQSSQNGAKIMVQSLSEDMIISEITEFQNTTNVFDDELNDVDFENLFNETDFGNDNISSAAPKILSIAPICSSFNPQIQKTVICKENATTGVLKAINAIGAPKIINKTSSCSSVKGAPAKTILCNDNPLSKAPITGPNPSLFKNELTNLDSLFSNNDLSTKKTDTSINAVAKLQPSKAVKTESVFNKFKFKPPDHSVKIPFEKNNSLETKNEATAPLCDTTSIFEQEMQGLDPNLLFLDDF